MGRLSSGPSRRGVVLGLIAGAMVAGAARPQPVGSVYVISRDRLLNESKPTRILREAEAGLTAKLQGEIDRVKAQLATEEADLTRRRDQIPAAEMAELATEFDRKVRSVRLQAQERAKAVQTAFQEARAALVQVLPPILEQLRTDVGAVAILNADQTLAIAPENDLTDRAIALLDQRMPDPDVPEVDVTLKLPETPPGGVPAPDGQD